jgi:hypothetical protein
MSISIHNIRCCPIWRSQSVRAQLPSPFFLSYHLIVTASIARHRNFFNTDRWVAASPCTLKSLNFLAAAARLACSIATS